jgi:hypothetical protein
LSIVAAAIVAAPVVVIVIIVVVVHRRPSQRVNAKRSAGIQAPTSGGAIEQRPVLDRDFGDFKRAVLVGVQASQQGFGALRFALLRPCNRWRCGDH